MGLLDIIEDSSDGNPAVSDPVLSDSGFELNFSREKLGVRLLDSLTIGENDLARLKTALESVDARGATGVPNDSSHQFQHANNAIYRDIPCSLFISNDKYRVANLTSSNWAGTVRTLGLLRCISDRTLVGWRVSRRALSSIPKLKNKLAYPTGSSSNRLGKTAQDFLDLHVIQPVYASVSVTFDASVSNLVAKEARFLSQAVPAGGFGMDFLELHRQAVELSGPYLVMAAAKHTELYVEAVRAFCTLNARWSIKDWEVAQQLLPIIVGAYNFASYGNLYHFINSKAYPDPIKVGNRGDVDGNGGSTADSPIDLAGNVGSLLSGGLSFIVDSLRPAKTNESGVGVPSIKQMPTKGWSKQPAPKGWDTLPSPDGGMMWNLTHMQSSNWLDGTTLHAAGGDWTKEERASFLPKRASELLTSAIAGSGTLVCDSSFDDYIFIPNLPVVTGNEGLINQGGSVINGVVDLYNPDVDGGDRICKVG